MEIQLVIDAPEETLTHTWVSEKVEEEKILYLEDRYCLNSGSWTPVTVRIQKWHHCGPRVKLSIIEGFYNTIEEIEKALTQCRVNPNRSDNPKH